MSDSDLVLPANESYSQTTPLPLLRYSKAGVLQQGWEVISYSDKKPTERRVEWRDVPTEE